MIYGPAGSGKSTQGEILAKEIGGKALSVGQICREKFLEYTKTAAMVPEDELAKAVLEEVKKEEAAGFLVVLDGQPWSRDSKGSTALADATEGAIIIDVPEAESIKRLELRGRADDELANWQKKLQMYREKMPIYEEMLKEDGVPTYHVDGVGTVEEVADRIKKLYKIIVQK